MKRSIAIFMIVGVLVACEGFKKAMGAHADVVAKAGSQELTVGSQKEFLLLWQRGVIAADDQVRREGQEGWTAAGDLPWIRGMQLDARKDSRRLFWLTLVLLLLGLAGALAPEERDLVKRLAEFPAVAAEAAERRAPHALPTYAIRVADDFHRFYHHHKVLGSPEEGFRLGLCSATKAVVARSLDLIGVDAPDRM